MLKRWQDDVLAFGWAYGPGGTMLRGKTLQLVLTAGGPESVYRVGGYNLYPVRELLRPLEVTAHLCGMTLAEPLVLYGVPNIPGLVVEHDATAAIAEFAARYRALVASLTVADSRHSRPAVSAFLAVTGYVTVRVPSLGADSAMTRGDCSRVRRRPARHFVAMRTCCICTGGRGGIHWFPAMP